MTDNIPDTFSFWQLINRYKIEIPVIQRDYAQGRKDDKAESIREQIIQAMMSALFDGTPLSFDFVYGRVADGVFIPIDGQQRLTTLWLLHVYLFKRCFAQQAEFCGKDCTHSKSGILSRFTYATRQSSREFCEAVSAKDILSRISEYQERNEGNPVEQCVKDQPWFCPDWAADPTVAGMLRTLDHIHKKLRGDPDHTELLKKLLKANCPITFVFLDMEKHDLTDDLYLNMNARGLPLTEFENFKASLEKYLQNHRAALRTIVDSFKPQNSNDRDTWGKISGDTPEKKIIWKLEHDWHDVFWNTGAPPDPIKTEQRMLSLFRRHFLNVLRLDNKDYDDMSKSLTLPVNDFSFTAFSVYENVLDKCRIDAAFKPIANLFEALARYGKNITDTKPSWPEESWDALSGKWEKDVQETYASRVRFFAVMRCFEMPVTDADTFKSTYTEWMRVVWNILEDTQINDSKDYQSTLKLINELGSHWEGILKWLADHGSETKPDWAKAQVKEEVEKARLLITEPAKWRPLIENAEGHYVLKGSLRFLMHGKNWEQKCEHRLNRASSVLGYGSKKTRVFAFRAFVSRFEDWGLFWRRLKYDASSDSWRKVLRVPVPCDDGTTGWITPLYKVLDTDSDETLHAWLKSKSELPNSDAEKKSKIAHEVLFRTDVIGNCADGAELKWREDCYYVLIPHRASADGKKVVLDKRQSDLRRLRDLKIADWQDKTPIVGIDVRFTYHGNPYIWYRDGKVYKFDTVTQSIPNKTAYCIDEAGELMQID